MTKAEEKRRAVVELGRWGITHEPQIYYSNRRPFPLRKPGQLPKLPLWADCSAWVTICYRYAGAADPNGLRYSGQGYTGTLLDHMKRIPIGAVKHGDVVIYGCASYANGHHAAVVIEVDSHTPGGIVTSSLGGSNGPMRITVANEAEYQPDGLRGVVYLSSIGR